MRLKAQSKNEKENFLPEVLFLMFHLLALMNKAFVHILKFRSSLFKGLHEPPVPAVALRRARNLFAGAFLLRLLLQKKKRELTHMRSMCVGVAETGGVGIYFLFWLLAGL